MKRNIDKSCFYCGRGSLDICRNDCFRNRKIYYLRKKFTKSIRNLIINFLNKRKFEVKHVSWKEEYTEFVDLENLIDSLKPMSIQTSFVRIGSEEDGGYIVPNIFDEVKVSNCFSPGVGEYSDFEIDLYEKYNIPSFLADNSIPHLPNPKEYLHFTKKHLGVINNKTDLTLDSWVENKTDKDNTNLILQMDIDYSEYEVILGTTSKTLNKFAILLIEFHRLQDLFLAKSFKFYKPTFEKLLQNHSVVHIHPNNNMPSKQIGNLIIPDTMEFTFLRNDLIKSSNKNLSFPHQLDTPNNQQKKDVILPKCWY